MLRRTIPLLLVTAMVLAACAEEAEQEEAVPAQEEALQAMDGIRAAYVEAYNARDAAGVAALFSADGVESPPLSPSLDPQGVEERLAAEFSTGPAVTLAVEQEGAFAAGDQAVGWGRFTVTPEGAEEPIGTGRYGVICKKQPDGSWKIYRHLWNYEVAPPAPPSIE